MSMQLINTNYTTLNEAYSNVHINKNSSDIPDILNGVK